MAPVRRRRVFYIAGFDPRGAPHYHKLYREEGAKQAKVDGIMLEVGPRKSVDALENAWTVATPETETLYSFLRWDDLVRARWPRGVVGIYWDILRYAWGFAGRGVFAMILRNGWPTFLTAVYPPALLLGLFVGALLIGWFVAWLLAPVLGGWSWLLVPASLGLPFLPRKPLEERLNAFWLARGCAFLVDRGGIGTPDVEERCKAFAQRIAGTVAEGGYDEVLVASHSVGTHLATTALAGAVDLMPETARLSFLTIGQTIAMAAVQPKAQNMRRDLLKVAVSEKVDWIDVSSAIDSSCVPLTDPLAAAGVARPPGAKLQPKLISARFIKLFTREGYKQVKRNFIRGHFQYLMAAELPGDYSYILVTAGPLSLADRYAGHQSVTGFDKLRVGKR